MCSPILLPGFLEDSRPEWSVRGQEMAQLAAHGLVFLRAGRRPGTAPKMGIQPQLEPPTNFCVIAEKPSAFPQPLSAFLPLLASSVFCGAKGSNPGPFPELYSSPVSTFSMDSSFLSPPQVTMQMTWDEGTLCTQDGLLPGSVDKRGSLHFQSFCKTHFQAALEAPVSRRAGKLWAK